MQGKEKERLIVTLRVTMIVIFWMNMLVVVFTYKRYQTKEEGLLKSLILKEGCAEHVSFLGCCLVFLLGKNKRRRDTKLRKTEVCEAFSVPSFPSHRTPGYQDCFPSPRRGERNHACCCFYYVKTKEEGIPRLFPVTP